jgi:hypothetical protein
MSLTVYKQTTHAVKVSFDRRQTRPASDSDRRLLLLLLLLSRRKTLE